MPPFQLATCAQPHLIFVQYDVGHVSNPLSVYLQLLVASASASCHSQCLEPTSVPCCATVMILLQQGVLLLPQQRCTDIVYLAHRWMGCGAGGQWHHYCRPHPVPSWHQGTCGLHPQQGVEVWYLCVLCGLLHACCMSAGARCVPAACVPVRPCFARPLSGFILA